MTLDLSSSVRTVLTPADLLITPEKGRNLLEAARRILEEKKVESWERLERLVHRRCDLDPNASVQANYSDRMTGAILVYHQGYERVIQIFLQPGQRTTTFCLRRNHHLPTFESVHQDTYGNYTLQRTIQTIQLPYVREEIDRLGKI